MSKIKLSLALSCLVITLSSLPVQSQGEVSCPTQVSYNEMKPSYSLYYVVNDEQIKLLKTQEGTSIELNLELDFSPVNHEFRMSPFGDQLFYGVSVPPSTSTYELYLFSLPIESDESLENAEYLATYNNMVPRFAWVTNDLIRFSTGNPRRQIVQINTTNKSALLMDSPSIPEDMWFDRGVRLFTNDLKYYLYSSDIEGDEIPNIQTGLAFLKIAPVQTEDSQKTQLLKGFTPSVRHSITNDIFFYQGEDFVWYTLTVQDGEYLQTFFNNLLDIQVFRPAIAPNGESIAVYAPYKAQQKLLILSKDEIPVDLCFYGDLLPQEKGLSIDSGLWSPDSEYFVFVSSIDGKPSIYIYDLQNNQFALVDTLNQKRSLISIIGFGN